MNTLYGFKQKQSQDYDARGLRIPVTWIKIDPSIIVGSKTQEKDGYNAIQIALGKRKYPNKPLQGLLKNLSEKITPRFIREIKSQATDEKQSTVGDKIQISDVFNSGDTVNVTGTTKGKGFAGAMKRHGFHGGPKTHGQSDRWRAPGSIGSTTTPGRVYKGKKMAGHMGADKSTSLKLTVFSVKPEENLLLVKGLVPGYSGGLLKITKV